MQKIIFLFMFLVLVTNSSWASTASEKIDQAKNRCGIAAPDEPNLYNSDFHWSYTPEEMKQRFNEVYNSGKRLAQRAYYNSSDDQFYVNHEAFSKLVPVKLSENFIKNVTMHIEESLKRDYTEFVFFPDMGHSHMMIDQKLFDEEIKNLPVSEMALAYEKMLNSEKSKYLYHTAEQLLVQDADKHLVNDRHVQWRFYTRNLVGTNNLSGRLQINKALDTLGNTVSKADNGYFLWSAGYHISASKDGCFAFEQKGQTLYFDISLRDLANDPKNPPSDGGFSTSPALFGTQNYESMPLWIWNRLNVWKY